MALSALLFSAIVYLSIIEIILGCNRELSTDHYISEYTNINRSFDPTSESNLDVTFRILSWDRNYVLAVHPKDGDAYIGDPVDLEILKPGKHSNVNELFRYANGYLILDNSIIISKDNCTKMGAFVLGFTNYYDNILELQWVPDITQAATLSNHNLQLINSGFGWIICNGNRTVCLGFVYADSNDSILTGIDYHPTIETNMHANWLFSVSENEQRNNSQISINHESQYISNHLKFMNQMNFDTNDPYIGRFRIVTSDGNFVLCAMESRDGSSMYLIQILDNTTSRKLEGFSLYPLNTRSSYNSKSNFGSEFPYIQSLLAESYIIQDLDHTFNSSSVLGILLNSSNDGIKLANISSLSYALQKPNPSRLTFHPTKYQNGTFYLCTGDSYDSQTTVSTYAPNSIDNYTWLNNSSRCNITSNLTEYYSSDYRKYPPSYPRKCLAHDSWGNLYIVHDQDPSLLGPEMHWSLISAMSGYDSHTRTL